MNPVESLLISPALSNPLIFTVRLLSNSLLFKYYKLHRKGLSNPNFIPRIPVTLKSRNNRSRPNITICCRLNYFDTFWLDLIRSGKTWPCSYAYKGMPAGFFFKNLSEFGMSLYIQPLYRICVLPCHLSCGWFFSHTLKQCKTVLTVPLCPMKPPFPYTWCYWSHSFLNRISFSLALLWYSTLVFYCSILLQHSTLVFYSEVGFISLLSIISSYCKVDIDFCQHIAFSFPDKENIQFSCLPVHTKCIMVGFSFI